MDQHVKQALVDMAGGAGAAVEPEIDEVVGDAASRVMGALAGLSVAQAESAIYAAQRAIRTAATLPR